MFLNYNLLEDTQADCKSCRATLTCRSWCYAECVDSTHTFYNPGKNYCQAVQILHDQVLQLHDRLRSSHPDILRRLVQPSAEAKGRPINR